MSDLAAQCIKEIHRLHQAIEGWTTGALPNTEEAFVAFAGAFAPNFVIINPNGKAEAASHVVPRFRDRHGERSRDFSIRITNEEVHDVTGDRALVTYREHWLHRAEEQSVILSSALMQADADRPGGLAWLHLHETWMRPPT